jgi:hypothetical protein
VAPGKSRKIEVPFVPDYCEGFLRLVAFEPKSPAKDANQVVP